MEFTNQYKSAAQKHQQKLEEQAVLGEEDQDQQHEDSSQNALEPHNSWWQRTWQFILE
jgi:hypothetical protein